MTFEHYIINKYPLYADVDYAKINVNWGEVFRLYNDYLKDNQPILTVDVHEPVNTCKGCGIEIPKFKEYCSLLGCAKGFRNMFGIKDETVKQTQDNHLKTRE